MEKAKLAILQAETKKQMLEIDKIYLRISKRTKNLNREVNVESVAYQLHNLYCAFEDLFKIIAQTFENKIEEGLTYHKELLRRMSIAIEGIRPNIISEESLNLLSELRAFRHFFRHTYFYQLDVKKVKLVLDKALRLKEIFKKDLEKFILCLKEK